ncbi:MAG: TetR family transcriptional regulator [Spirochaetaceae bacterium]|nr:MAG: TetR family transcriptional regulator [Spirochaetaceae bacterium]
MSRKDIPDRRRKEIMESCYQVIARKGLEGATLKRIGREMGVAPSLLIHYFKNKEELMVALVEYMVEKMETTLLPGLEKLKNAKERLSYYIDKTLNFDVAQTVDDKVFYGCFYLALKDERIRKSFQRMYNRDSDIVIRLINDYVEEEGITGIDPEQIAVQITSYIEGFYIYRVVFGDTPKFQRAVRGLKQLLWYVLEGKVR